MRDAMLLIHFIGLAMGIGTGFAFLFLGIASSKMPKEEAKKFMMNAFPITLMGKIGLTLLLASGIYLMMPYWEILSSLPLLIAKLVLVLVLLTLVGINSVYARKARAGEADVYLPKMQFIGRFSLPTGVAIVVLAVLVFH